MTTQRIAFCPRWHLIGCFLHAHVQQVDSTDLGKLGLTAPVVNSFSTDSGTRAAMFKKSVSVQTTRPLSGKDVKTLRRSVQLQFPDADEDAVAQLLPAKAEIALLKLSNRAACYTVNGGSPLFFDPDGRGDILAPTVYALWLCPQLLPPVFTYSEVSPKVRRRRPVHGGMRDPLPPCCAQAWHWHSACTAAQGAGSFATCVHQAGLRAQPHAG